MDRRAMLALFALCLLPLAAIAAEPAEKPEATDEKSDAAETYIRLQRGDDEEPTSLDTATVRFKRTDGDERETTVDLVGVIHFGDKRYYDKLNKQLAEYDVVLYELVRPEGFDIANLGQQQDSGNPISMMQNGLRSMLELDSQLECVDYSGKNFVHADLSPEQMGEAIRKRGDSGTSIFFKVLADVIAQASRQSAKGSSYNDFDVISAMLDSNGSEKLKKIFAEQLVDVGVGTGLGGTLETILIDDRNAAAMKVLNSEIEKGNRKIAIFYGAAHMPDFEKRLTEDLGFQRDSESWLSAWDMSARTKPTPLQRLLKSLAE